MPEKNNIDHLVEFEALFKQYYHTLVAKSYQICHNWQMAEDAVQEFFADIWEKKSWKNITSNPSSYMVRGISNKTISLLRKAGRDTELTESDGQIPETNEFSSGESESQLNRELQLIQALNELPAQRKEAFLLAHFYNFSYLEISNRMQISVNTVKTHLRLAMLQLRETLLSILTFLFFS